jgi:hypothetical protein
MSAIERINELDVRARSIVVEIVRDGYFPSAEVVTSVLCQRYGVYSVDQLQCGCSFNIPTLSVLTDIQAKVLKCWYPSYLPALTSILLYSFTVGCTHS